MKQKNVLQKGYTLPELLIVMGILALLMSISTIILLKSERSISVFSITAQLLSDLKQQQLKAMSGATEGRATADSYGVHFDTNDYVLFHGDSYNANDTTNLLIPLETNYAFSPINLPSGTIIFSQLSGEVAGFSSTQHSFVVKTTIGNEQETITINRYGVVTGVN